jgi:hypothetical protein
MATSDLLARVAASGTITSEDALAVRRSVYGGDVAITPDEMEKLLQVDDRARNADPAWTELLAEAGADFLVNQQPPAGYVSEDNAAWLTERICRDGIVNTPRQFELLVHIIERATSAPGHLAGLALKQVELAIIEGRGPLAGNGIERGRITKAPVDVLRRILYAFGGDGAVAVTMSEAEVLFDLNDATADASNDPSWNDLFVKAIASYVMAASGYMPLSREAALADQRWLDAPTGGLGGFFARMTAGGLSGILSAYKLPGDEEDWDARSRQKIDEMTRAEVVTADEAAWLADRFGRDGRLHENEKALLRFIRDEAPSVHPSLMPLIEKAAA